MSEIRNNWSRNELILAFNLYCTIPFRQAVKTNPKVINLANLIGRSPSAVAMKLGNFGRSSGSKADIQIWEEFSQNWDTLVVESESLILQYTQLENKISLETEESIKQGISIERTVKVRLNQSFFRQSLLCSYNYKCAITDISNQVLLVASHIVPWSVDEKNRLNPTNGILLNSLHDKAFDAGLISITPDYKIILSSKLGEYDSSWVKEYFLQFENKKINLPEKFLPDKNFLDYHNSQVFLK